MDENAVGTNGDRAGTNGFPPWPLFAVIAGFLLAVIIVNITSHVMENRGMAMPLWEPALWEFSSYFAILILTPAIYYGYGRFHWRRLGMPRFLAIQAVAFIAFSLCHIALMAGFRFAVYGLLHQHYDFAQGNLPMVLLYEGRKDALTFVLIMGITWAHERLQAQGIRHLPERLEFRTGTRTLYLDPRDISHIEAAGNYVELYQANASKPLLLRGTLNEFEMRLKARGFVRVHRSRLINRHHIAGFEGTPSGDVRIRLRDGQELAGSRRYRDNLDTPAA